MPQRAMLTIRYLVLSLLAVVVSSMAAYCENATVYDDHDYSAYAGYWSVIWRPPDGPPIYGEVVIDGLYDIVSIFGEYPKDLGERTVFMFARLQAGNLYGEFDRPGPSRSKVVLRASDGGQSLVGRAHWGHVDHGTVLFNRMVPWGTAQVCCGVGD